MTREELKAHLQANEEHVRQMTQEVTQTLDDHLEEMREDRASFKSEVGSRLADMRKELEKMHRDVTWTLWMSLTALGVLLVLITLLTLLVG
jgi:DNA anti-recombination protein RmuC